MVDPKSKVRVERLLRGDFRPEDLMNLFLYARDHCDGREAIKDIGAFVAHHDERDRGLITRSTRDWFAVARFHMSAFRPPNLSPAPTFDGQRMPVATQDYFKIAVNRIDAASIRQRTGLSRARAYQVMNGLVARLKRNSDGTWALPDDLTREELNLANCVSSAMVVRGAFEADRLCDDFIVTLKSNGLITKDEIRSHKDNLDVLVQLYAVAVMHNCIVQIGDGTSTQLKAKVHPGANEISVTASVPGTLPGMPGVHIAASMFTAKLDPSAHCHADLLANQDWNFEIEVSLDRRLSPMR